MCLIEKYRNDILMNKQNRDHFMNHMFNGFDMDRTMLRIGAMNMMTHGVESPNIEYRDSLSDQNTDNNKYSMILANPPFKGSLDYDSVSTDLLKIAKTKKTELLFLALFIRMLKVGGDVHVLFQMEFCLVQVRHTKRFDKQSLMTIVLKQLFQCHQVYLNHMLVYLQVF